MRFAAAPGVALAAAFFAIGTPAAAQEAALDAVLAQAHASPPPAFERHLTITRAAGGKTTTSERTDTLHFDPAHLPQWKLLRVNGQRPTPKDLRRYQKDVGQSPVPGFHRLPILLEGPPTSSRQQGDTLTFFWARLAPGAIGRKGPDISPHLSAIASIDISGKIPQLRETRVYAARPFTLLLVAHIRQFEAISTYRPGKDGIPFLARQEVTMDASLPFEGSGVTHSLSTFTPAN